MNLQIKSKNECTYDEVSMGWVMLLRVAGGCRIITAKSFNAVDGGGFLVVSIGFAMFFMLM